MSRTPLGEDQITIHGTLVLYNKDGILLRGEAGVGKSTAALEYLADGGQLVADDVVVIKRVGNKLYGAAPPLLKGILAIPELGIFDVREVYGRKYFKESSLLTRCVVLGRLGEPGNGEDYAKFLGLRVPRSKWSVACSRKNGAFLRAVDLVSVKTSEARFIEGHGRMVASSRGR